MFFTNNHAGYYIKELELYELPNGVGRFLNGGSSVRDFGNDVSKPLQRQVLAGERTMTFREAVEKHIFKISPISV